MIVKGLDGKEYRWNPKHSPKENPSQLHILARELLKEIFPFNRIFEEVALPGCKNVLFGDFHVVNEFMIVEVQGQQHYQFSKFFHGSKIGYNRSLNRDNRKKEWCRINNFYFVELPYNESTDEWRNRIYNRAKMA